MGDITTEAWVIYQDTDEAGAARVPRPAVLQREPFSFSDIDDHEILCEPLYGCWEANMTHALERRPIDVCRFRSEERVVLGNAGVLRVLRAGRAVAGFKEGDLCMLFCNGIWDEHGYPDKILAYDAPGTMGVLAKRMKLHERQAIKIPAGSRLSPRQWAAFSLRYVTAWANWKHAHACWSLSGGRHTTEAPHVWGWGGGVSLAELALAKHFGCEAALCSSGDARLSLIERLGIEPIDRRRFPDLYFDESRYEESADYRKAYRASEEKFLAAVMEQTGGRGVAIFVDYIGAPVFRATLKALRRPGVITTAGWKLGMTTSSVRALECMHWHIHVYTHYARYEQGLEAIDFAEETGWGPPVEGDEVYGWDDIPLLAERYAAGALSTYFPLFEVNPL